MLDFVWWKVMKFILASHINIAFCFSTNWSYEILKYFLHRTLWYSWQVEGLLVSCTLLCFGSWQEIVRKNVDKALNVNFFISWTFRAWSKTHHLFKALGFHTLMSIQFVDKELWSFVLTCYCGIWRIRLTLFTIAVWVKILQFTFKLLHLQNW